MVHGGGSTPPLGTKAIMPYNSLNLRIMRKLDYLVKIGQTDNFDKAWDEICEVLDIDAEDSKIGIFPNIEPVRNITASSPIRMEIGKWVFTYDLDLLAFAYLEDNDLVPYYGQGYTFTKFQQENSAK